MDEGILKEAKRESGEYGGGQAEEIERDMRIGAVRRREIQSSGGYKRLNSIEV
jgi:hypothetical protein